MFYDSKTHQMVPNPDAKYAFGAICVRACPRTDLVALMFEPLPHPLDTEQPNFLSVPLPSDNYVVTGGWCVRACGTGMFEMKENGIHHCRPCDGPCPKGRQVAPIRAITRGHLAPPGRQSYQSMMKSIKTGKCIFTNIKNRLDV